MPQPLSPSDALSRSMRGLSAPSTSSSSSPTAPKPPKSKPPPPSPPSPSSSILLISPTNRILLLHRVTTSRTFASAHVFPGGHVSPPQDGALPRISDPACHEDGLPYRMAGVRECFEESGILLARRKGGMGMGGGMVRLSEREREEGRRDVHADRVDFRAWVEDRAGEIDVDGLVPFTRWLTPANIERRFSTQMYLYFLPLQEEGGGGDGNMQEREEDMHIPTPDGGVEHTAAAFLYPSEWLDQSLRGEIVLFPPQFFLLSLLADFLAPPSSPSTKASAGGVGEVSGSGQALPQLLQQQRDRLMDFVANDGEPPWGEKCISPNTLKLDRKRGSMIMGLADPGPELEGTGRVGDRERVIRVDFDEKERERGRQRPRPREVIWRRKGEWEGVKL